MEVHIDLLYTITISVIYRYVLLASLSLLSLSLTPSAGDPNLDSLQLLGSQNITTVNANFHMQVQTVSFDSPISLPFNHSGQTLVVVMTTPLMEEGYIAGGGQVNTDIDVLGGQPTGQTFVGGGCLSELEVSNSTVQWYVRLQGSSTYTSVGSTSGDSYSEIELIVMIVAASVIAVVFIGFSYYVMTKNSDKLARHVKLDVGEDSRL
jgi:hypothetical protein